MKYLQFAILLFSLQSYGQIDSNIKAKWILNVQDTLYYKVTIRRNDSNEITEFNKKYDYAISGYSRDTIELNLIQYSNLNLKIWENEKKQIEFFCDTKEKSRKFIGYKGMVLKNYYLNNDTIYGLYEEAPYSFLDDIIIQPFLKGVQVNKPFTVQSYPFEGLHYLLYDYSSGFANANLTIDTIVVKDKDTIANFNYDNMSLIEGHFYSKEGINNLCIICLGKGEFSLTHGRLIDFSFDVFIGSSGVINLKRSYKITIYTSS